MEMRVVLNSLEWVMGTKLRSSEEQFEILDIETPLQRLGSEF